jgi:hypothetical protein
MLTPRVSEELMRYQQGEHRGGAPPAHASGRSRSPTADEFVQDLTLFKFHAKGVSVNGTLETPLVLPPLAAQCVRFSLRDRHHRKERGQFTLE